MRRRGIYTTLIIICVVGFWVFENFYTPATYSDPSASSTKSRIAPELLPKSNTGQVIYHDHFMLSYSEPHEQAEWVAYELKKEHLTYDDRRRPYFLEDPKVRTKSADWRNYKRSGYDRGHLCPAGDRRFSEYAYNETFYTSNIVPQDKAFNAGVWNRLEQQIRYWCKAYGSLYVITGGVLKEDLPEIGEEGVDVPEQFYKIVFRRDGKHISVLAFLFPHKESPAPLNDFLVSVDSLEVISGLDFFHKLEAPVQKKMESTIDAASWKF